MRRSDYIKSAARIALTYSIRHFSILRSRTFFYVPDAGPYDGTTNQNFIYFYTSPNTFDASALPSSLLRRRLNRSMPSYVQRVFILTVMPHHETSPKLLHKETVSATCSAVAYLTSVECYLPPKVTHQHKPRIHLRLETGRPQEPVSCLLCRPPTQLQVTWAWTTGLL